MLRARSQRRQRMGLRICAGRLWSAPHAAHRRVRSCAPTDGLGWRRSRKRWRPSTRRYSTTRLRATRHSVACSVHSAVYVVLRSLTGTCAIQCGVCFRVYPRTRKIQTHRDASTHARTHAHAHTHTSLPFAPTRLPAFGAPQVLLRLGLLSTPGAAKLKQPTETLRLDDRADLMASPPQTL